jgi:hypothetical protein
MPTTVSDVPDNTATIMVSGGKHENEVQALPDSRLVDRMRRGLRSFGRRRETAEVIPHTGRAAVDEVSQASGQD